MDYFFGTKDSRKSADKKINDLISHIEGYDANKEFLSLLNGRLEEFNQILKKPGLKEWEKTPVLKQYRRFVDTVHWCSKSPNAAERKIDYYLHQAPYHPVGIYEDKSIAAPVKHPLATVAAGIGAALIIAAIISFPLCPMAAVVLLPIGITTLASSLFVLFGGDPIDVTQKKQDEEAIFLMATKLILMPIDVPADDEQIALAH